MKSIAEEKVVNIIKKLRNSLENGDVKLENFPLEEVLVLVENTLGGEFWKGVGTRYPEYFSQMPKDYRDMLEHLIKKNDVDGCIKFLQVYETQYKCMQTAVGRDEQISREKLYKQIILNMGNTCSKIQCRLHEDAQKNWGGENTFTSKRGVVYTCMIGECAEIYEPEYKNPFWDYICFTDRKEMLGTKKGIWEFRQAENPDGLSARMLKEYYMINPHKVFTEYDFSIWVDSNMKIVGELESMYKIYGRGSSLLVFPDYLHDDIYDIIKTTMGTDDINMLCRKRLKKYQSEGMPKHYGVIDTRVMFRNHNDELLIKVLDEWWNDAVEYVAYSEYGFNYLAWKNNFKFALCDLFVENNVYIKNMLMDLELTLPEEE